MRAYGKKKISTEVEGHQDCGVCHPVQKNKTTRARQEGKVMIRNRPGKSSSVTLNTAVYRPIPGNEELEIEVEVSGTANPYWAGNYDNPPEGGDVEDITAIFYDEVAKKDREIPLSNDELEDFSMRLAEKAAENAADQYDERERDEDY